jgi:hypothetical protein
VAHYLLVIGDREALGWLLSEQRMAFRSLTREVRALAPGDHLLLYTTRGCFGNPGRDRGRVIASGLAASAATRLEQVVQVAGRSFSFGCRVEFTTATAWPKGVELAPLVSRLELFSGASEHWSARMRRPLVSFPTRDARKLDQLLTKLSPQPLDDVIGFYTQWWKVGTP